VFCGFLFALSKATFTRTRVRLWYSCAGSSKQEFARIPMAAVQYEYFKVQSALVLGPVLGNPCQ